MRIEVPIRDSLWDTDYRNAFQTDLKRKYHSRYFMIAAPWFGTGRGTADALVPIHAALQAANVPIQLNTTRGVTPGPVDPTQVNGRHIPHPALPPRIYQRRRHNGQPVLRNSRQAPASHTPDGDTNIDDYEYDDEDSGEDNYEEEVPGQNSVNVDNGVSGECGCSDDGEGLTAPSSNAINHPSAASEEVVAGRLRSSRRRLPSTPPANSFTPINPTSTQRKRHQKRVTPHQVQKKILSTSNLKAFLKSKGSTVDVDELLEWTEGCQNGGDDADREDPAPSLRGSRRQHRPHTPTTEIPDTVSHAGKQPTRRAIVPLGEQSTQTNGPSTAINGRRMSDPIAEHRYDLPLSAYIGDPTLHVTRHQSSYLNNQWIPRAPTAPMNIPSAFDRARPHIQEVPRAPLAPTNPHFAGVVARAPGPFMYSSQGLHFDEAPSYLMPPPSHQANGERSGYTSFQQALNNRNSPAPSANSSSINSTSDQNNAGYEPCGSWFECDDLFREYEGW